MKCQNTKVNLCSQQARHDVFEKIKIFPNLRENQFPKSEGLHNHEQSLRPLTNIINITITFFFILTRQTILHSLVPFMVTISQWK